MGDGEKGGKGDMEVEGRGRLYTYHYTVSDESHFNVSVGSDG